jgi:molybdenum cofactor cytidylyltransferase
MHITLIIPAAGLSSRHPDNKLLYLIDHKTVIDHTISTFLDLPVDIIVIIGNRLNEFKDILSKYKTQIKVLDNLNYLRGKSSSIHKGILGSDTSTDYYGFCNGDLPFIKSDTIKLLLNILETKKPPILVPTYQKQIGHPIFFNRNLRDKLLNTSGDYGGISIVDMHPNAQYVEIDDPGITLDMDKYLTYD